MVFIPHYNPLHVDTSTRTNLADNHQRQLTARFVVRNYTMPGLNLSSKKYTETEYMFVLR